MSVPGDRRRSRKRGSHLDDQRGEADTVARCRAPGRSPPPVIVRRSCGWRQVAPVEHIRVDLDTEKLGDVVQEMSHEERKQMEEKRGAGVVGIDRSFELSPAAMEGRRTRSWAAWRRGVRVFEGKRRGRRGA